MIWGHVIFISLYMETYMYINMDMIVNTYTPVFGFFSYSSVFEA